MAWLDQEAFPAHVREHDAEAAVGEAMKQAGLRDYYTKSQLAEGEVPDTRAGTKISEQLFPGRKLVRNRRPRHLHRRLQQGHRPRLAL